MHYGDRDSSRATPRILFADSPGTTTAKTVADLCAEHLGALRRRLAKRRVKPRTLAEVERLYRTCILPAFAATPLAALDLLRVETWHADLTSARGPVVANRAARVLRTAWRIGERYRLVPADQLNPTEQLDPNPEAPRERVLTDAERTSMLAWLDEAETRPADRLAALAVRLLALTGARRNEILLCRWEWIDWTAAEIRLPDSKTGRKRIALSAEAVALLERVGTARPGPVFPRVNYRRVWYPMRAAIGAPDIALHDLRRTYCSALADLGVPVEDVAALVGQKTVAVQRDHYRQLSAARRRELADRAAAALAPTHN